MYRILIVISAFLISFCGHGKRAEFTELIKYLQHSKIIYRKDWSEEELQKVHDHALSYIQGLAPEAACALESDEFTIHQM